MGLIYAAQSTQSQPVTHGNHRIEGIKLIGNKNNRNVGITIQYRDKVEIENCIIESYREMAIYALGTNNGGLNDPPDNGYYANSLKIRECTLRNNRHNSFVDSPDRGAYEFQPMQAEAVTGDESVCLGGYGLWTTNVSGGTGEYTYQWYVTDYDPYHLYYDYDPSCYWDSNSGSWNLGNAGVYLTVNDGETIIVCDPFFFEITSCRKEGGDSIQIYPNPASEYINVAIIDETETDKLFPGQVIQLNNSKKTNGRTACRPSPLEHPWLSYLERLQN
jgi:hypothetical protein